MCRSHPKLARITASHPRTLVSTKSALNVPPATFTSVSILPKRSMPSLNVWLTASASRTSTTAASGSSPAAVISATACCKQLLVLVEEHEVHARLGEVDGDGAAEAAATPGDQRHLALQSCSVFEVSHAGIIAHDGRRAPVEAQPAVGSAAG